MASLQTVDHTEFYCIICWVTNINKRTLAMVLVLGLLILVVYLFRPVTNRYDSLRLLSSAETVASVQSPLLGIAFGGGGVRGFMHVGVIKALQENGIQASLVIGSSAGAIAAVLYASGLDYSQLKAEIDSIGVLELADPVLSLRGVANGRKLARWINRVIDHVPLQNLQLPVAVTVADLTRNETRLVVAGDAGHAVQASSSIPGFFLPVHAGSSTLVDGGLTALVPVRFARQLGATIVIGVDVFCGARQALQANMLNTLLAGFRMQGCAAAAVEMHEADILISPDFEPPSFRSFSGRAQSIEAGYQATLAVLPALRELLLQQHNASTTGELK